MLKPLNNHGNVVVMVVLIFAVLALLGTSSLALVSQQNNTVNLQEHSEDALYYAEAGYNMYLYHLNQDSKYYDTEESDTLLASDQSYRDGFYRLQIIEPTLDNPVVTVRSTGWSAQHPDRKRTIEVAIHKRQFSQSVSLMGQMTTPDNRDIFLGDGEQIHGPFHSNDDLRTKDRPVFWDEVTYVDRYTPIGSKRPDFKKPGQPVKTTMLAFPVTNTQLSDWGKTEQGGLTYVGRTCICLTGTTMKIKNESNNDVLENVSIPTSDVVYVKTANSKYGDVIISGQLDGKLSIVADHDIYIVGKDPTDFTITNQTKFNAATNLGGITYADDSIPTSADWSGHQTDDLLGLVATGNIWISTRRWPKEGGGFDSKIYTAVKDINVYAVLFGHGSDSTFGVENYASARNEGYLHLKGAIITKYRSATYDGASGNNYRGYKEDNWYDYRLSYDTPPHFLEPTNAGWEVRKWKEITNP